MKSRLQNVETVHILEALWLSAILIIPTVCVSHYFIVSESASANSQVPKVALLRTISGAMLVTYLYQIKNIQLIWPSSLSIQTFLSNIKHSHETLVMVAVLLFTLSTIITTALSTNVTVSIWGFIPGQDGHSTYNSLCFLVIFVVIVTNLKSSDQLRRLLLTIITMGVIVSSVGFFQHFGFNLFGFLPTLNSGTTDAQYSRAILTTDNAVTAGSLLLIPIIITLAFSSAHLYKISLNHDYNKTFAIKLILWSAILSVQFSALLFTLSRGPGIAIISAIILLITALIIFRKFHVATIATAVVTIATMLTISINSISVEYINEPATPQLIERIADVKTQISTGGLNQRISLWASSAELIIDRPWFDSMDLTMPGIRSLVGYGPGTFVYVFNLTSEPSVFNGAPLEASHAHNYFIHKTVTEGILGLVSSVGLLGAPILMSGLFLLLRKNNSTLQIICLSGIFAMFSGRLAEQLIGVASVSDLTVFWISLAASVAAVKILSPNELIQNPDVHNQNEITKGTFNVSLQVFVLVLAALTILLITAFHAIIYPLSGVVAGASRSAYTSRDLETSLSNIETAIVMTPDVPYYYLFKSTILIGIMNNSEMAIHPSCNKQSNHITERESYRQCLANEVYSTLNAGMQIQPFWYPSTLEFAYVAKRYGLTNEALLAYERLAQLLPTNRAILHLLSEEYIALGMFTDAWDVLKQSLTISRANPESGNNDYFTRQAIKLMEEAE